MVLGSSAVAPAAAVVLPINVVKSGEWTWSDGYTTYTCRSTIQMSIKATTVVGTSTVRCDKSFLMMTIDGVFGPSIADVKLCTYATSCSMTLTKSNPSGVQRHCYGMSTISMNGAMFVPNSGLSNICHSN